MSGVGGRCYTEAMTRALLLLALLCGCGNAAGPPSRSEAMQKIDRQRAGWVGQYTVYFGKTFTQPRRLLVESALSAHHLALDSAVFQHGWTSLMPPPGPFGVVWPPRNVYVHDVPLLRSPTHLAVLGFVDSDRGIHLVAGDGDTLPAATETIVRSVYLPYDSYSQHAVWPYVLGVQKQTVATLRQVRGLP